MNDGNELKEYLEYTNATRQLYERMLSDAAGKFGLSCEQAKLLLELNTGTRAAISGYSDNVLPQLISTGLVTGTENPKISGKGAIIAKSLNETQRKYLKNMTSGLTPDERSDFFRIIQKIAANIIHDLR